MGVHNLEKKEAFTEAIEKPDLTVVDFFATWCGPCKAIAPKIVEYSQEYEQVHFYKVDVDELPDVAQEMGVSAMPTFMLFKAGNKVAEIVGANSKAIEAAIKANLE